MPALDDRELHAVVRYEPVLRLIRELGAGTLLEIGAGHLGLRGYGLAEGEWDLTIVEYGIAEYEAQAAVVDGHRRVLGDARDLPFADESFDVTLALDLLEHIAPGDRPQVLSELARVTRRRVIVGCPTGAAALEADRGLPPVFARLSQPVPTWLQEHFENGLPEPEELEAGLASFGPVRLIGNENVRTHALLMRFHLWMWWRRPVRWGVNALAAAMAGGAPSAPPARRLAAASARPFVRILRGLDRPPHYRTIAVADRRA